MKLSEYEYFEKMCIFISRTMNSIEFMNNFEKHKKTNTPLSEHEQRLEKSWKKLKEKCEDEAVYYVMQLCTLLLKCSF